MTRIGRVVSAAALGLAFAALVPIAPPSAVACTYASVPGDEVVEGDLVFTGTAVAVNDRSPSGFQSANGYRWWTFAIDSVRHGQPTVRESVQTADSSASCGAPLELGHRYLVGVGTDSWVISGASIHELPALADPPPVESSILTDVGKFAPLLVVAAALIGAGALAFRRRGA